MSDSTDEMIKRFRKIAAKLRKEHKDPAKAKAFLIRAGIIEKHASSPNGIRLVKQLR
jgi:hypothetical protein